MATRRGNGAARSRIPLRGTELAKLEPTINETWVSFFGPSKGPPHLQDTLPDPGRRLPRNAEFEPINLFRGVPAQCTDPPDATSSLP